MTRDYFDLLAAIVDYPDEYTGIVVSQAASRSDIPGVKAALDGFLEVYSQLSIEEMREHYAATFRPGTACSLELGDHLFDTRQERDAFLSRQLDALHRTGLEPATNVPDHLSRVLAVVGRDEPAKAADLAAVAAPAVEKVRRALINLHSPYAEVMAVVRAAMLQVQPADAAARR